MQHYMASDLGLPCLPMTLLGIFRKESVKGENINIILKWKETGIIVLPHIILHSFLSSHDRWSLL